jgi:hypothetical protein
VPGHGRAGSVKIEPRKMERRFGSMSAMASCI